MHGCQRWRGILPLAIGIALSGCSTGHLPAVAGAIPGGLQAFLATHPLAEGQPLRADEVARAPGVSWHLVQVRGAESPHRHRQHDLTVLMLRGEGVLTLDGHVTPMHAGDAALIPRDRPHWFARRGSAPAVSLVALSPPLDAPDLVPEAGVDTMGGHR